MSILVGFLLVSALIVIHELGHFLVGRLCGIRALSFSIGFGKALAAVRWGHTVYKVCIIPLGGYVRFVSKQDAPADPPATGNAIRELLFPMTEAESRLLAERSSEIPHDASPARQIAMILGGPLANIATAFLCAVLIPVFLMRFYSYSPELRVGEIRHQALTAAGLTIGDHIQAINGTPVATWTEFGTAVLDAGEQPVDVEVLRPDAEGLARSATLRIDPLPEPLPGPLLLQIRPVSIEQTRSLQQNVQDAVALMWHLTKKILASVGIAVRAPIEHGTGMLQTYHVIGQSSVHGDLGVIGPIITVSLMLGLLNLLPLPALDGGQLVFLFWELVTGKALPLALRRPAENIFLGTFLVLVLLLLVKDLQFFAA